MGKTCFVVMPIGEQAYEDISLSAGELRKRYDDLIREALLRAEPTLEIMRADDVSAPGAITSDILTRLMHADLVVADITFPNPNVFYELGLRHACSIGTIIIRDKMGPRPPFDIANLRHIEYENTPSGLKTLASNFRAFLDHFDRNPVSPDSQFQEVAKLINSQFPNYSKPDEEMSPEVTAMLAMMQSPELMDLFSRQGRGEEVDQREILEVMARNPDVAGVVLQALVKSGQISFQSPPPTQRSQPSVKRPQTPKKGRKRR
jgi:hypothetical protein